MKTEINYVKCRCCGDYFPDYSMLGDTCIVCETFKKEPKKSFIDRIVEFFKTATV